MKEIVVPVVAIIAAIGASTLTGWALLGLGLLPSGNLAIGQIVGICLTGGYILLFLAIGYWFADKRG